MPQERVGAGVDGGDMIVMAIEIFEFRIVRKIDFRKSVIVDIQFDQFRIV